MKHLITTGMMIFLLSPLAMAKTVIKPYNFKQNNMVQKMRLQNWLEPMLNWQVADRDGDDSPTEPPSFPPAPVLRQVHFKAEVYKHTFISNPDNGGDFSREIAFQLEGDTSLKDCRSNEAYCFNEQSFHEFEIEYKGQKFTGIIGVDSYVFNARYDSSSIISEGDIKSMNAWLYFNFKDDGEIPPEYPESLWDLTSTRTLGASNSILFMHPQVMMVCKIPSEPTPEPTPSRQVNRDSNCTVSHTEFFSAIVEFEDVGR